MQRKLWLHKVMLASDPNRLGAAYLISGLPSLHLAVPIVGSYYLRHVHVALSILSWIFVAVTFVTTLYFGWHYLLDNLAGVLLAVLIIRQVRRYFALRRVYVEEMPGQ
jgi:membrane-associated phospholipid phosphatase